MNMLTTIHCSWCRKLPIDAPSACVLRLHQQLRCAPDLWRRQSDRREAGLHDRGRQCGSRLYVTEKNGKKYKMFKLLNREFTLDVDVKTMNCGMNGAVYFIEMDKKGGEGQTNHAGAKFGTGYCDAQCPHEKFETNASWGICCVEMDIWGSQQICHGLHASPMQHRGTSTLWRRHRLRLRWKWGALEGPLR